MSKEANSYKNILTYFLPQLTDCKILIHYKTWIELSINQKSQVNLTEIL